MLTVRERVRCPECGRGAVRFEHRGLYGAATFYHANRGQETICLPVQVWQGWYKVWLNDVRARILAMSNMGMNVDETDGLSEAVSLMYQGVWEGMAFDVAEGRMTQCEAEAEAERVVDDEVEGWREQLRPYDDLSAIPTCWGHADEVMRKWRMIP